MNNMEYIRVKNTELINDVLNEKVAQFVESVAGLYGVDLKIQDTDWQTVYDLKSLILDKMVELGVEVLDDDDFSSNTMSVINQHGTKFNVRIIKEGESYGSSNSLIHDDINPLIEFYDARYPHTQYGQFVTRYMASTLIEHEDGYGLSLDGGVDSWYVNSKNMSQIKDFIRNNI